MRVATLILSLVPLSALASCQAIKAATSNMVPYEPDRELVAVIPREQAKAALADVLTRATTRKGQDAGYSEPLEEIDVRDEDFAFTATVYSGITGFKDESRRTFRFVYTDLDPLAFTVPLSDSYVVALYGREPGRYDDPVNGAFWCSSQEDVETALDALHALKAAAAE